MKRVLFMLFAVLFISSCKDKDKLLTQDSWYLSQKSTIDLVSGSSKNATLFYKKSEKVLAFKFDINGTVLVNEDKGVKHARVRWKWKNKKKEHIIIITGTNSGEFRVTDLNKTDFTISKMAPDFSYSEYLYFKHLDNKEWYDDNMVDRMNEAYQSLEKPN